MDVPLWVGWLIGTVSAIVVVTTYPYLATAISYRQRDNGLAYIVMILGIAVWNGFLILQLLDSDPLVQVFFYSLSVVGALLAGLGWFLFACTASSTPVIPRARFVFGGVGILVGLDIVLTVTAVSHGVYWQSPGAGLIGSPFATITPEVGYWIHTQFVVLLFLGGAILFAQAWSRGRDVTYTRAYTLAAIATAIAVLVSNVLAPGGFTLAPIVAAGLPTIGWFQAQ